MSIQECANGRRARVVVRSVVLCVQSEVYPPLSNLSFALFDVAINVLGFGAFLLRLGPNTVLTFVAMELLRGLIAAVYEC